MGEEDCSVGFLNYNDPFAPTYSKKTLLPLVMWNTHAFSSKKINSVSKKMDITCNYTILIYVNFQIYLEKLCNLFKNKVITVLF